MKKQKLMMHLKKIFSSVVNFTAVISPESAINNPLADRDVCWKALDMYHVLSESCSTTHLHIKFKLPLRAR